MAPAPIPGSSSTIFINEVHYDNTGTDAGEFIEVAGPAGTDLTGWRIELYNGAGGARYDNDPLTGTIPAQLGGYGTVSISYPVMAYKMAIPDGIALVNPSNVVVQFLCYEGTFTATGLVGTALGLTCTDIGVTEDAYDADRPIAPASRHRNNCRRLHLGWTNRQYSKQPQHGTEFRRRGYRANSRKYKSGQRCTQRCRQLKHQHYIQ